MKTTQHSTKHTVHESIKSKGVWGYDDIKGIGPDAEAELNPSDRPTIGDEVPYNTEDDGGEKSGTIKRAKLVPVLTLEGINQNGTFAKGLIFRPSDEDPTLIWVAEVE